MWPDLINGVFELVGASLIILSIKKLLEDKMVAGVHWSPVLFFTAWGYWNLFYYPGLDQWFSFAGAVLMVTANTVWLVLIVKYWRK